jgi:tRNA(fMet)-specific endonuclease VapC
MACLDTTLILDLRMRGGPRLRDRARRKIKDLDRSGDALTTTIFNVAELWVGIERADDPAAEQGVVEELLKPLVVLGFDEASARSFGQITATLQKRGRPAGDMDVFIASVALFHGEKLITRNPIHFADIPGLLVESY